MLKPFEEGEIVDVLFGVDWEPGEVVEVMFDVPFVTFSYDTKYDDWYPMHDLDTGLLQNIKNIWTDLNASEPCILFQEFCVQLADKNFQQSFKI